MRLPPGVFRVRTRGRDYWYHQPGRGSKAPGPRARIPGDPEDPRFWTFLRGLAGGSLEPEGSVARAVDLWRASPAWARLAEATRRDYARYAELIVARWEGRALRLIEPADVVALQDSFGDRVVSGNHAVSVAGSLFRWAVRAGLAERNPAREVGHVETDSAGAAPWPDWAYALVERHGRWELRAAVALARYTGQRTRDVVAMTLRDVEGGRVRLRQSKTGKHVSIPIHPALAPLLEEARRRGTIALVPGPRGEPLTAERFRALYYRELAKPWAEPLRAAGLSMHGHRKGAVCALLEMGCTLAQVAAITRLSLSMVDHYGRLRDQERLADEAMARWVRGVDTARREP